MSKKKLLKELKVELVKAVPRLFKQLTKEHDDLCCFGLGTTAILESIVPIYQFENLLASPDDAEKFSPWEWEMGNGAVDLGPKVPRIRTKLEELLDYSDDDNFQDDYKNTVVSSLVELKKNGAFGTPKSRPFLAFWLIGDDERWVIKSSKLLNTPKTHGAAIEALGG